MTTTVQLKFDEEASAYLDYAAAVSGKTVQQFVAAICRRNDFREVISDNALDVVFNYERLHNLPRSTASSDKAPESEFNQCWRNMVSNRAALRV